MAMTLCLSNGEIIQRIPMRLIIFMIHDSAMECPLINIGQLKCRTHEKPTGRDSYKAHERLGSVL